MTDHDITLLVNTIWLTVAFWWLINCQNKMTEIKSELKKVKSGNLTALKACGILLDFKLKDLSEEEKNLKNKP